MGNHGFKEKLEVALIVIGVYIIFSIITGAALAFTDIASFGAGFVFTALWMGGLAGIILRDMR